MAAFDGVKKRAEKAVKTGHNPAEKMEGVWHPGTPYRPVGCFSDSEAIPNPTPRYPTKIYLPHRPTSDEKNENAKKI